MTEAMTLILKLLAIIVFGMAATNVPSRMPLVPLGLLLWLLSTL